MKLGARVAWVARARLRSPALGKDDAVSEQPPEHTAFAGDERDGEDPPGPETEPEDAEAVEDEYHGPDPEKDESGTADNEDQGI